jgi:hypothetical protein
LNFPASTARSSGGFFLPVSLATSPLLLRSLADLIHLLIVSLPVASCAAASR